MLTMMPRPLPVNLMRSMHMPTDRETAMVEILLVEDSPDDANLMIEALAGGCLNAHITWVDNGDEALDFLRRQGKYTASGPANLVLLDLILPRKNGHEVLTDIKQDPILRRIPIVIMTGTDNEEAFRMAYDLHANCCVSKPADQEEFVLAVKKIETFWLRVARRS